LRKFVGLPKGHNYENKSYPRRRARWRAGIHGRIPKTNERKTTMKPTKQLTLIALFAASFALPVFAQTPPASILTPDKVETRIGTLDFKDGAPSRGGESATVEFDRTVAGGRAAVVTRH
jgi:hypothetical protein